MYGVAAKRLNERVKRNESRFPEDFMFQLPARWGAQQKREERMYYENVFRSLQKNNIRYAVAGGVALVLHGVVRFTADLDLIVDLGPGNLSRFVRALTELGYRPRNPVNAGEFLDPATREKWKREKGMEVFSFVDPSQPMTMVDVFIEEKIPFREVMQETVHMEAGGITIPVVSLRHLKMLKKAAGRPQDLADIEAIEALESEDEKS
ncbi:MAG TPA: nucleotidyl transferase AbiEii/AbiGii toxin family protein [Nitrospirota bacterium]